MSFRNAFFPALSLTVGVLLAACGSDDGNTSSGVDSGKQLSTLSGADVGKICDWMASKYGGYKKSLACNGKTATTWADQSTCVAGFSDQFMSCKDGTVSQLEACTNKEAANPCDPAALTSAECQTLDKACGN